MLPQDEPGTLVDRRRVWHFWIDDEVLDTYGALIGPYGIAVYAYLARRSKAQSSFPSYPRIARDIGISRDKAIRTIKALQAHGLIRAESRLNEHGAPTSNRYILQDLSHLHSVVAEKDGVVAEKDGVVAEKDGVVAVNYVGSSCKIPEVFSLKEKDKIKKETPLSTGAVDIPPALQLQPQSTSGTKAAPTKERKPIATAYSPDFLTFWHQYPRKVGKPDAWKAWGKGRCEAISAQILQSVLDHQRYEPTWQAEARFIPHPASFLNAARWEDELDIPIAGAKRSLAL